MSLLSTFSEAAYLLARFCPPSGTGPHGGRVWERTVISALRRSGGHAVQEPGGLTLFGTRSASGLSHELDGACARGEITLVVEAKAVFDGPTKADVCLFDRKTFDLYVARVRTGQAGAHHRLLVSSTPMREDLRAYCYLYGIIGIDPLLLPLPMLLKMASRPAADLFIDSVLLSELVRLGEPACVPMEARYEPQGDSLRFNLQAPSHKDLEDLGWLHRVVSDELLEALDVELPDYFEERAPLLLPPSTLPEGATSMTLTP